jgi:hemolysin III
MSTSEVHPTSGYTRVEEVWNSLTHGFAIPLAVAGWVLLLVFSIPFGDPWMVFACCVYGFSLVLLYTASALYHSVRSLRWKKAFLIFDHCCIYILIAGSYTPFALGPLRGPLGWTILGIIWALALAGVFHECRRAKRGGVVSAVVYLGMGWLSLTVMIPLYFKISTTGFAALVAGGVVYSLGVVFYLKKRMKFHHAIWHVFVVGGSIFQYLAVLSLLFLKP